MKKASFKSLLAVFALLTVLGSLSSCNRGYGCYFAASQPTQEEMQPTQEGRVFFSPDTEVTDARTVAP